MRKTFWTKALSLVLTVVFLLGAVPMTVMPTLAAGELEVLNTQVTEPPSVNEILHSSQPELTMNSPSLSAASEEDVDPADKAKGFYNNESLWLTNDDLATLFSSTSTQIQSRLGSKVAFQCAGMAQEAYQNTDDMDYSVMRLNGFTIDSPYSAGISVLGKIQIVLGYKDFSSPLNGKIERVYSVAFKGSDTANDLLNDALGLIEKAWWVGKGTVHFGISAVYAEYITMVIPQIQRVHPDFLNSEKNAYLVSGHSLGGALAELFTLDAKTGNSNLVGSSAGVSAENVACYTVAALAVGDKVLYKYAAENNVTSRIHKSLNTFDVIPQSVSSKYYTLSANPYVFGGLNDIITPFKNHSCIETYIPQLYNLAKDWRDNNGANSDGYSDGSFTDSSGNIQSDFTYTVSNGEATITKYNGTAARLAIPAYLGGYPVVAIDGEYSTGAFEYYDSLTSLTIPNSVTSIGDETFYYCVSLESVTIPNSVTSIGDYAFYGCSSLESVIIPNSLTSINYAAFYGCRSLTSVTIPNSVVSIDEFAFSLCTNLTSISIPNGVTSIAERAFDDCTSLTSATIPNSVTKIGSSSFYNCPIETLSIDMETIPATTFSSKPIINLILGHNVKEIEGYKKGSLFYSAFHSCTSLTSLTIPNGVTTIGDYAFADCDSLLSVTIPNSVTNAGVYVFRDCPIEELNINMSTIPGNAYGGLFNSKPIKTLMLGNNVTCIGSRAFSDCSSITSVSIPNSVTNIDDFAFSGCSSLTSIIIPNSVILIGIGAFMNCSSLTSVTIPNSVTNIGRSAFDHCPIENLNIDMTTVPGDEWIELPDGASVNYNGLFNNKPIKNLTIGNNVITIGDDAFADCDSLLSVIIPNSVTSIGGYAFYGCSSLTNIIIPEGVTNISGNTFEDCTGLKSVTIPNSVTNIGNKSFSGCINLTTVTIPDGVTHIGERAFQDCESLTSLTIPNSVTSISGYAFISCKNLTIYVPNQRLKILASGEGVPDERIVIGEETTFTITATATTGGTVSGGGTVNADASVMLTATTNSGYMFDGWYENDVRIADAGATYTFTVTANRTLQARFTVIPHTEGAWEVVTPATCTESGTRIKKCTDCGEVLETEAIPATGHTVGEWETTIPATYTQPGTRVKKCTKCGEILVTESIPVIEPEPEISLGDVTGDGEINIFDIMAIRNYIFGTADLVGDAYTAADVNSDEEINIFDIMAIRNHIFGTAMLV